MVDFNKSGRYNKSLWYCPPLGCPHFWRPWYNKLCHSLGGNLTQFHKRSGGLRINIAIDPILTPSLTETARCQFLGRWSWGSGGLEVWGSGYLGLSRLIQGIYWADLSISFFRLHFRLHLRLHFWLHFRLNFWLHCCRIPTNVSIPSQLSVDW